MKKCYIIFEFGGKWEDSWELPIKVFLSKENAETYIKEHENIESRSISTEAYGRLLEEIDSLPESFPEEIYKKYPGMDLEELKKADIKYFRDIHEYIGMKITEVELCQ